MATERDNFLHLGCSGMERCEHSDEDTHTTSQSAAPWCTTEAQQKEGLETAQEGHWCTHPGTAVLFFNF